MRSNRTALKFLEENTDGMQLGMVWMTDAFAPEMEVNFVMHFNVWIVV